MFPARMEVDINKVIIVEHTKSENHKADALYQGKTLGFTRFTFDDSKKELHMSWIEVKAPFRKQGVASLLLDYLSETAVNKNYQFVIHMLDIDLLNTLYAKWYSNRSNPKKNSNLVSEVNSQYKALTGNISEHYPTLILSPKDLSWRPKTLQEDQPQQLRR